VFLPLGQQPSLKSDLALPARESIFFDQKGLYCPTRQTPSFLRRAFDVFSEPPPKTAAETARGHRAVKFSFSIAPLPLPATNNPSPVFFFYIYFRVSQVKTLGICKDEIIMYVSVGPFSFFHLFFLWRIQQVVRAFCHSFQEAARPGGFFSLSVLTPFGSPSSSVFFSSRFGSLRTGYRSQHPPARVFSAQIISRRVLLLFSSLVISWPPSSMLREFFHQHRRTLVPCFLRWPRFPFFM